LLANNFAQRGGAIFSSSGYGIQTINSYNVFTSNIAEYFCSNVCTSPSKLRIITSEGTAVRNLVISSHFSGKLSVSSSHSILNLTNLLFLSFLFYLEILFGALSY